mgnify:CR=1 FL=1
MDTPFSLGFLRPLLLPPGTAPAMPTGLLPAAVLVPLYYDEKGQPRVLLTQRTQEVEHHKGEVSFPGGARDPCDRDLVATALREAEEEVGVEPGRVEVLGFLPPVTTRSRFAILPVVGSLAALPLLKANAREVAAVLEVPLSTLLDPSLLREEAHLRDGRVTRGLAFVYNRSVIYGATARILTEFIRRLARALGREVPWRDSQMGFAA